MTRGHKHYIISTGRNHEYLLEARPKIFLATELKVFIAAKQPSRDISEPTVVPSTSSRAAFPSFGAWWLYMGTSGLPITPPVDLCLRYLEPVVAEGLGARQTVHSTQGAYHQQTRLPHTLGTHSLPRLPMGTAVNT